MKLAVAVEPVERLAYSAREVADMLGLSYTTVRSMLRGNKLDHVRIGHRIVESNGCRRWSPNTETSHSAQS